MDSETRTDRRSFLKNTVRIGAAAAAAFPVPHVMAETAKGANDTDRRRIHRRRRSKRCPSGHRPELSEARDRPAGCRL